MKGNQRKVFLNQITTSNHFLMQHVLTKCMIKTRDKVKLKLCFEDEILSFIQDASTSSASAL